MLAVALVVFECLELGALAGLVSAMLAAGGNPGVAVLAVAAIAFGWRALLVLATCLASGVGWPGWKPWLGETRCFTLAYLAMTIEPLRARPRPEAMARDAARLVLLHGWCCNAGAWGPLRAAWMRRGGDPPLAVSLEPVLGDIDAMARNLARRLAPLVARREPLLLVAHSMGGLVARRWLQQDAAGARCVTGLLTVGSPHAGTTVAWLGPGRAAAQMRPGDPWLARLGSQPPPCPVRCLWSRIDGFVAPAASAVLPGSEALELDGRGHFGMLRDPRLLPAIVDWMARCSRRRDPRDAVALTGGSR